jgi:hypothetical protein
VEAGQEQVKIPVEAPGVAGSTVLGETRGINQADTAGEGSGFGVAQGQQGKEEPKEPGASEVKTFAPGGGGQVGKANEHSPGGKSGQSKLVKGKNENGTKQVSGTGKATDTYKGT